MSVPHGAAPPIRPSKYRSTHCWWCEACNVPVDAVSAKTAKCLGCGAGPPAANVIHFDSKRERSRWCELRVFELADKINDLRRQVSFPIKINDTKIGVYRCDFHYIEDGQVVVEDVKSKPTITALYKFKKKCVEAQHGITIREIF